jgi:phage terminase small subunit
LPQSELTKVFNRAKKGGNHKGGSRVARELVLTDKQTKLVDTLVSTGCSIREAAESAGYAAGESGRVSACKALRQPHVQQYMMQSVNEALGLNATVAASKLLSLARGAKSEYVQLEASKDILDRAGFKPPDKQLHLHAGEIKVSIDLS